MNKTELNFKGLLCPMPIIKFSTAMKNAVSGDIFVVTADDMIFEPDIRAWCKQTGNTLNSITKSGTEIIATVTKK